MQVKAGGQMVLAILFAVCNSTPLDGAELTAKLPPGMQWEEATPDAGAAKVVLVAGSSVYKPGEHEYVGGCAVLADLLRQTPGVFPVLALDWPKKPATLSGAKAVVFFFDGGKKHGLLDPEHLAEMKRLANAGVGLVFFHQGIDVPKELGPQVRQWMGAAFEKGYSQRAHWIAEFDHFPDHPICRGVTPFTINDGWLFRLRFASDMHGVAPLLRTVSPKTPAGQSAGDDSIVSWAYERPGGGRSFTFTGCHLHRSFAEEGYRKFLTNGVFWTAAVEIPATGATVALPAADLDKYLLAQPPKGNE